MATNQDSLDKVYKAGSIQIEELMLLKAGSDGVDVMEQLMELVIYEDMYSPFITGTLTLFDTLDLPGVFGRAGRDMLWIKMYTPSIAADQYIQGYFVIYKMGPRVESRDRAQTYTYSFASAEMLQDMNGTISKTFEGTPHEIANTISTKYLATEKKVTTENCTNKLKYTSNFWSPIQNMNYITQHAKSSNGSNLLFFENRQGFNLQSMAAMTSNDVPLLQSWESNDFSAEFNTNKTDKISFATATIEPGQDYHVAQVVRVDIGYDFLRDYESGMISTKMYAHDFVTKKLQISNYTMSGDSPPLYNKNKLYTDGVIASMSPKILTMSKHTNVNDRGDMTDYDWKQKRIGQLGQFTASMIEIEVFGKTDYTVGKKVFISMNKMRLISKDDAEGDFIDKYYSGYYIITAIAHKINRVQHMCTIELSRNGTNLQ
jgi:hypothetical protein